MINGTSLLFCLSVGATIGLTVGIGVAALVIGAFGGLFIHSLVTKKKIGEAKQVANKMVEEAIAEAKTLRKEAILESKEEIHKERVEFDKEVKDRRNELQRSEMRIQQKEESLEKSWKTNRN